MRFALLGSLLLVACAHTAAPRTQGPWFDRAAFSTPAGPLCGRTLGQGPLRFVYLHGGPGFRSGDFARAVAPRLADHGATVATFDQRGAGCSPEAKGPGAYSVEAQVADATAVIDDVGGPVVLVGHSYGGLLAAHVALAHPDRIAGLVLVDAPLDLDHALGRLMDACIARAKPADAEALRHARGRPLSEQIAALGEHAPDCTPSLLVPPGHHPTFEETEAADRASGYGDADLQHGGGMNRVTWRSWPEPLRLPRGALAHAPFPVLAVWGALDPYFPDPSQDGLPTKVLRDVGHMSPEEAPDQLADALLTFGNSPAVRERLSNRR
jgi:pimeloyl-ACP methyl ester carboxylesterase